ncbi:MAG: hypothetical protein O9327_02110 [Polaromonas sp.]|nr:hypothetical protein [Polaromonas sp.]
MTPIEELEVASREADARLGVAEDMGWAIAGLSAGILHFLFGNWFAVGIGFVVVYVGVTHPYRKRSKVAETAYYREAKLGPFFKPPTTDSDTEVDQRG